MTEQEARDQFPIGSEVEILGLGRAIVEEIRMTNPPGANPRYFSPLLVCHYPHRNDTRYVWPWHCTPVPPFDVDADRVKAVFVDRETAYGSTVRLSRSIRVF